MRRNSIRISAVGSRTFANVLHNTFAMDVFLRSTGVKIDHNFSSSDTLMFRFSRGDRTFITPLNVPGVAYNGYFAANEYLPQVIDNRGAALSYNHIFSPRIINEFRAGYNRLYATPRSDGKNLASEFGIKGVPDDVQSNGLTVEDLW